MADKNTVGLSKADYVGAKSTLCTGCGHDSITQALITACYQSNVDPSRFVKLSGIGCSSKTPAYFMNQSHGFNTIHGRMAAVATGVKLAHHGLSLIGISGDGDTASIGLGSFSHMIRRQLPMVYIVENNGVYGLTKGQFSATADEGSAQKNGDINPFESIDLCSLALQLGCGFVARSFSGDARQLVPLLRAAFLYPGTALIDIVSPCVTFANHVGSTKSYTAVKQAHSPLQELGFISPADEIKVDYNEGESVQVRLHDGSTLHLKKLRSEDHDISDASKTLKLLFDTRQSGLVLTGLLHYNSNLDETLLSQLQLTREPLAKLNAAETRPSQAAFESLLKAYR
jgi:2-oxoglutarate ferredoxin oxidoreductase subunit beta